MRKIILFTSVLLVGTLILNSCKKKEDDEAAPSKSSLLTGTWKMTAAMADPGMLIPYFDTITFELKYDTIEDIFNELFPDCQKDNLYKFMSDKTYSFEEGATPCDTVDVLDTGTWKLSSDGKTITTDSDSGDPSDGTIKSLTSTTLVITDTSTTGGILNTFTQTFTKQ